MRLGGVPVSVMIVAGALLAPALSAGSAAAQGPADARLRALESRVQNLEARLSALEGRGSAAAPATAGAGVPCRSVSVLAVWATPQSPLTVSVNGAPVGVYDDSISVTLDSFLRPGANTVRLSYPGPARASTEAALKCRPPGSDSASTILTLKPAPGRLQADSTIDFVRGR